MHVVEGVDGYQTIGKVLTPDWRVWSPSSYCLRVAARRGAGLAGRSRGSPAATPSARPGRHPPLSLEVRLDAVGAALLDGLSYRRAGRAVGISTTGVGDSLDLLLGPLGALGFCQFNGTFIATLDDLRRGAAGDGRCRRGGRGGRAGNPGAATRGWTSQKVLYDAKRHSRTARGLSVASIWGDLLWLDGGWPGSCHELELIKLADLRGCWTRSRWQPYWTAGSAGWPRPASFGMPRSGTAAPSAGSAMSRGPATVCRRGCARWWNSRSPTWPAPGRCAAGAGCSRVCDVFRAAGALTCLGRWLHRVPAISVQAGRASP
jgi:hypothetical protein